ncbi:hypothetical protein J4N42_14100 [Vibrio sp. SCSIO 43135]|uniref:hypothetical protein n=1 Tax=Vibrio sp. SCSIO 43135 TaxID=2819096 RepID=UPI002075EF79|nr:hypothetical protein [Vibrio sp. SCSIO 43135]USD41109.1 hypothetical protein J4N42_14100 [Vibrio sp. SCSIO 43135]
MAKRFCKLNRHDIASNLGEIHQLVTEPKYVCRSCARSSASKSSLCKPAAIPPKSCQDKPIEQQRQCGLLAEALSDNQETKLEQVASAVLPSVEVEVVDTAPSEKTSKKALKKASKALKKQKKYHKKLSKVLKKQQKLLKKHQKLEGKFAQVNGQLATLSSTPVEVSTHSQVH